MSEREPLDAIPPRSGIRSGPARAAGRCLDALLDGRQAVLRVGPKIDELAAQLPARKVAVLGIYGQDGTESMAAAIEELGRSRHNCELVLGAMGATSPRLAAQTRAEGMEGGKLANLNRLLPEVPSSAEWVLLLDDDAGLPRGFLDRLLALAEHFDLSLAQPALTHASNTAWPLVLRRPCLLRRTRFVEMGPVVLMRPTALAELTPFPEQGMGWGADLHWAAVAQRHGWRLGIADAVPVRHERRATGTGYDPAEAKQAALELLAEREHLKWHEADEVLETFRAL